MDALEKTRKKADALVGKTFTLSSLRREVDRILPNAWWGKAPTPRGICIWAERNGIGLSIQLDRTDSKQKFTVRKTDTERVAEP